MSGPAAIPPGAVQATAREPCEHYWAYHCYGGLSVRLCQCCHEPDWDDLRGQLAEAERKGTLAERERCARLAGKAGAIYPLPRPVPAVTVNGEPAGDTAGNTVIWPDGMPAVGLVSCLLREQP